MKLVTRKQLIELPNGTVFHPIDEDGFLGAAQVKYTSLANDFTSMYLDTAWCHYIKADALKKGESIDMSDDLLSLSREGLFDDSFTYLVLNQEEINAMKQFLDGTVGVE